MREREKERGEERDREGGVIGWCPIVPRLKDKMIPEIIFFSLWENATAKMEKNDTQKVQEEGFRLDKMGSITDVCGEF